MSDCSGSCLRQSRGAGDAVIRTTLFIKNDMFKLRPSDNQVSAPLICTTTSPSASTHFNPSLRTLLLLAT